MGNSSSKPTTGDSNLDKILTSNDRRGSGLPCLEDPRINNHVWEASSNTSDFCHICLDVLSDTSEYGATKYHSTLFSFEKSVQSGCHLCSLVRHFLPERPRHQLDERLTLSLRWDGN